MEPQVSNELMVVGSIFDSLLKSLIQMPDFRKADTVMLKDGSGKVFDSLKPTTNSLGGMLLDGAKTALFSVIDSWKVAAPGVLVVGATPAAVTEHAISGARKRSREEVDKLIRSEGGDPSQFAPWILVILQLLPSAIELIRKLLGK